MNFLQSKWMTVALFAVLGAGAVAPLLVTDTRLPQWIEVVLGGLMSGVLYSLVALGLVLIFKASGVFNFAQGAMVLFAWQLPWRHAQHSSFCCCPPLWAAYSHLGC